MIEDNFIFSFECPNCGQMCFEEDYEAGYCSGCGSEFEFETEDAAQIELKTFTIEIAEIFSAISAFNP